MSSPDDLSWLADVGSRLRERRVSSGISLEEAAEQTRLSVRQIVAIEEGDRSRLPADVYVRGFVRVYARALGLPDPVPESGDQSLIPPPPGGERKQRRPPLVRRLMIPGGLLVAMILLSFLYRDPLPTPPPPALGLRTSAPPPQEGGFPHRSSHISPTSPSSPEPAVPPEEGKEPPPPEPSGVVLKMKATDDCWLQVTIDETISRQYDLKGGDLIEWKAARVIALDIGNAGGVEAELNGTPLPPFGKRGEVVHRVLTAEPSPRTPRGGPPPSE